jgi:cytochrome oxidase Cu insertion factor (SCO1/SenC/PrrC family)
MRRRRHLTVLGLATALVVALAFVVAVSLRGPSSHSPSTGASAASAASAFDGAALQVPVSAPGFALTDQQGRRVALARYRGQVTLIAFLSSTCGATCVVVAQQIRGALDELPPGVPALIVSTSPGTDTSASVAGFLARVSLTGRVRYLTGPVSRLRPVWRAYHVAPPGHDRVAIERSVSVVLVDGRGRERVLFGLEQLTPESLAHDIRRLETG